MTHLSDFNARVRHDDRAVAKDGDVGTEGGAGPVDAELAQVHADAFLQPAVRSVPSSNLIEK